MTRLAWVLLAVAAPLAAQRQYNGRDWKLDEKDTVKHTFRMAGGHKLQVDNIRGFVHVTGTPASQAQITVEKHIYADSKEAMEAAKRDVKLQLTEEGGLARIYVDSPSRSGGDCCCCERDYRVVFDIEAEVPFDTALELKTLNNAVVVKKTTGDYQIKGLNGPVEMEDVSGSGSVHVLNGKVKVTYTKNPAQPTSFDTLNGSIDVWFAPGLAADLNIQRLNGAVFSDFEVAAKPVTVSANGTGRFVYRGGRSISGRIGAGGPELKFHTLNGTIRLHSK